MKILSVNTGSSSLKYQLYNMPQKEVICSGIAERIGLPEGVFNIKINGVKHTEDLFIKDHTEAVDLVLRYFKKFNVISDFSEIKGIGNRIVQGGSIFNKSVLVDEEVKKHIYDLSSLAPLHNKAHLLGIEGFEKAIPSAKQVVVFDTAFHQSMPEESFLYSLPYDWYKEYNVRKYGFHGISHRYVSGEVIKSLNLSSDNNGIIVCHLGNGASICAVKNSKSYDTSMGFTPLAGIPMGTRSGDIDPAIVGYIADKLHITCDEIILKLNKESGFKGLSGSSDARDIEEKIYQNDELAKLTLQIYSKKVSEFIAAYALSLGRVDAIVFTAGIGENSPMFRKSIVNRLKTLGIELDEEKNTDLRGKKEIISTENSNIKVLVQPTNEELVIAEDTYSLVKEN